MVSQGKTEPLTRVYTVPLGRVMISPRHKRAKKAVSIIKDFAVKNMKSPLVQISPELNEILWAKGIRKPPKRVIVKMEKDEEGVVMVSIAKKEIAQKE